MINPTCESQTTRLFCSAVHVTKFSPNNVNIMSAGDDKIVCCWDLPTEQRIMSLKGHEDYIRTGCVNPAR